jgi:RNA polymerase sigma-70 factor (ECF subfamily)
MTDVTIGPMLGESYAGHRNALFGLCYRMTGSAADADDVVQETFRRALEHPPRDAEAPLRPWLMRIATNLCIDLLRKRRRERYFGPWLPAPVETAQLIESLEPSPEARYGTLESASVAFLLALEVLDPRQRAVLVLRDVLGMSAAEVGDVLSLSAENVRVILHRARKALESYDANRIEIDDRVREQTKEALHRFISALAAGDAGAIVALLSEDAQSTTDAGGEFRASVRVVIGASQIARLLLNLLPHAGEPISMRELDVNGLPAIAVVFRQKSPRLAHRYVASVELGRDGKISQVRAFVATRKLTAIRFDGTCAE